MTPFFAIIFIWAFAYVSVLLLYWQGWNRRRARLGKSESESESESESGVTIVVPFRNEAQNLPACIASLKKLDYPKELLEIIFVNDHSTDASAASARSAGEILLELEDNESGKKAALTRAITAAKFSTILTLDADSVVNAEWLNTMMKTMQNGNYLAVGGLVVFKKEEGFLNAFLNVEMCSLMGMTAGGINNKKPLLANGTNLMFSKEAFIEVKGYEGDGYASGDDVFLVQKIAKKYGANRIGFNNEEESIVATQGVRATASEFTHLTIGHFAAFVVNQHHLVVGTHRAAASFQQHLFGVTGAHKHQQAFAHAKVFLHKGVAKQLPCAQAHLRLHALTSALDELHRIQWVIGDGGVVDQADQQSRHHLDVGDPMSLNQRKHLARAGVAMQNHRRALEHEALNARTRQGQVVGNRQHQQQHRIRADLHHFSGDLGVVGVIVVGAGNQLGDAGGAARQLKNAGIGGVDGDVAPIICRSLGGLVNQRAQIMLAGPGLAQHQAQLQTRLGCLHPVDHGAKGKVARTVRINATSGLRQLGELADFGKPVGDQRGNRDAADFLQRKVQNHKLSHIGQGGHHAVQGLEPQVHQVERQIAAQAVDIGVGVLALTVDQGHARAMLAKHIIKLIAQGAVFPIAFGPVLGRIFGRERNKTFQHIESSGGTGEAAVNDDDFTGHKTVALDQAHHGLGHIVGSDTALERRELGALAHQVVVFVAQHALHPLAFHPPRRHRIDANFWP